jgi:HK97 gp10 family phage protein
MVTATIGVKTTRQHREFVTLKKELRSKAHRAVYNFARGSVKDAKVLAPKRTGYMASQIKWKRNAAGDYTVYVDGDTRSGTGAYYAVYVEYGTRHQAAQPFFTPAIENRKRLFIEEMAQVFK